MEKQHSINGVAGRMWVIKNPGVRAPQCHDAQKWISEARPVKGYGEAAFLRVEMRHDDACKNGHNTFTLTGDVTNARGRDIGGGCLHDDIARVFPELAHLIKWHLCSTDGPMHYAANTLHLAGDADCGGRRAGEPSAWSYGVRFNGVPVVHTLRDAFYKFLTEDRSGFDFEVIRYDHRDRGITGKYQFSPKFTFGGYAEHWHQCPFETEDAARTFLLALQTCRPEFVRTPTAFSEGKARELDAARSAAVWPDATDAELSVPRAELEAALRARLPGLLAAFRADLEGAGFAFDYTEGAEA